MILILFVDALGYHYLDDSRIWKNFKTIFKSFTPAKSFLAYSAGIHASIWTSSYIADHRKWLNYRLKKFPEKEVHISKLLWKMESAITFISKRLTKNWDRYYIPKALSPYFKKLNYDFNKPFYHEKIPSLFKMLEENDLNFQFLHLTTTEQIQITDLLQEVNIIFTDEFDALGHKMGPNSEEIKRRILDLLARIKKIMKKRKDLTIFLFSDHGMNEVTQQLNFFKNLKYLEKRGYKLGKDYIFFADSTLIRFWTKSKKINEIIFEILSKEPCQFLSFEDKEKYKLPFDASFGDLIFLANPGVEVFPNFFHPSYSSFVKGLHGYSPESRNSYGIFATNRKLKSKDFSLLDISPTILKFLGVKTPKIWKGKAHDLY